QAPVDRAGERGDLRRQAGQLGGGARHGERELGARAEAGVRRNGAMDPKIRPHLDRLVRGEAAGELEHARRVGPLGRETRGWAGFEQQRRRRDRGPDPAEAATQVAPQVEHAEMKPRWNPRCTTRLTMRARGGVASSAATRTSRQEQAASSTTPRTTVAGLAGNATLEIAPCANSKTSSVRFTTAAPVASRFLNVVVSRNGLMTISSSAHSTPMGAKFTAPRASMVVRMDSMITAPTPSRPPGARRRR